MQSDPAALRSLAGEIERAEVAHIARLLGLAWEVAHHGGYGPEGDWDTCEQCALFIHALEAKAYLSAAEMLVPAGAGGELLSIMLKRSWRGETEVLLLDSLTGATSNADAPTPALALAAAALRATAGMMEDTSNG